MPSFVFDEAVREKLLAADDATDLDTELAALMHLDRPTVLRRLKGRFTALSLGERQAVANALGRANRASQALADTSGVAAQLPPPPSPPPPPPPSVTEIKRIAVAALSATNDCQDDHSILAQHSPAATCRALADLEALPASHFRILRDALELGSLRIGFYATQLSERGTEVALYDYADFAETVLGATSYVLYNETHEGNVPSVRAKFVSRFGDRCIGIDYPIDLDPKLTGGGVLRREGITFLYVLKIGPEAAGGPRLDGFEGSGVRTLVHAVFDGRSPHGDSFARISPCVPGIAPVVPHIVRSRAAEGSDLRQALGIPAHATVFGRHGGRDTFDIGFARDAVVDVARAKPDSVYFVFLNTARLEGAEELPNILHLDEPLIDDEAKSDFIRSCDAMIHARSRGETFGLACMEFAAHNRPVLTSSEHTDGGVARFHVDVLGPSALLYRDKETLLEMLLTFDRDATLRKGIGSYWKQPTLAFEPHRVMRTFRSVFLAPFLGGDDAVRAATSSREIVSRRNSK